MKHTLSTNNLIAAYQKYLKLDNATFMLIQHEDAMVAMVYNIVTATGEQLILKICPRAEDFHREVYFLKYFTEKLPVPRIVDLIEPATDVYGAVLMQHLCGELMSQVALTDRLAYQAGSLLARVHLNRTQAYGDLTQPQTFTNDPRIPFMLKFEEGFAECSNHLPKELLDRCRHHFDMHVNELSTVDGPCIIHRDFRPGNIIVHNDNIQGIVDWASGRASFAQEDLCPLEHAGWHIPEVMKASFFAGYASIRPVPDYQAMIPLLRLSRAFATIGFTIKNNTWKTQHACVYQENRQFLEFLDKRITQ